MSRHIDARELNKIIVNHELWLHIEGGKRADLTNADLTNADLKWADLTNADLAGADLARANLARANLAGANLFFPQACPTDGEFVAWKKVNGLIVKLRILDDSKRSSATTAKCRCDKALVLGIENLDGTDAEVQSVVNHNFAECVYEVGKIVYADSWDENRWNECSHGIHFFIDRESAVRW